MASKKASQHVFFPHKRIRREQDRLLRDVLHAVEQKRHLIAHAPTGLGKTSAVLSPALSYAMREGKTVFFLTPKISQHEIAVQLVKDLNKKFGLGIKGVDLVGRKHMCSDPLLSETESGSFYELCKRRRRSEACEFYANIVGFDSAQREKARFYQSELKREYEKEGIWSHLELKDYCENAFNGKGFCAYEAAMLLARNAGIVIADYYHLFNSGVQRVILQRLKRKLEDCIVVVDEAHNLPERVRKLLSSSLSVYALDKALLELNKLNQPGLKESLRGIRKTVKEISKKRLSSKREGLISKRALSAELKKLGDDSLTAELKELGAEYLEAFPQGRSFLVSIANFLERWEEESPSYIRLVKRSERNASIQLKALDASVVTREIFERSHSSVLMSGTLLPTKMYADLLGLSESRTDLKEYSSPFPRENKLSMIVPSVTTKYSMRSSAEFEKIASIVSGIVNRVPGNSAVFFPSFELLEAVSSFLEEKTSRKLLKQKSRMSSRERSALLNEFRACGNGFGAVLLAVASGSFAEGIDYLGDQLLASIVVGIPLSEMDLETECLISYYQEKFGSGWHYGYLYPAVARAIQASGRVIRDRADRGITAFLDKRYTWPNYKNCFPKDFELIVTEKPGKLVEEFWEKK